MSVGGCSRKDDAQSRALPSASASAVPVDVSALSASDRLAAATALCGERSDCDPARARALVAAAGDERERDALRTAASPALFTRLEAVLRARLKPGKVDAYGAGGRTLRITSDRCDGFLVEHVVLSTEGRTGAALGFERVRCQHGGAILEAALGN